VWRDGGVTSFHDIVFDFFRHQKKDNDTMKKIFSHPRLKKDIFI